MQEESLWDPIKMQGDRADPLFQVQQIFCVPESEGEGSVSQKIEKKKLNVKIA